MINKEMKEFSTKFSLPTKYSDPDRNEKMVKVKLIIKNCLNIKAWRYFKNAPG